MKGEIVMKKPKHDLMRFAALMLGLTITIAALGCASDNQTVKNSVDEEKQNNEQNKTKSH